MVILSLVRSNPNGEVGFLAEPRRLNVAITRAKRHVAVIANVETVAHDPILKGLMEYLEKHGDMRSAMQYEHLVREIDIRRPDGLELTLKDALVPREISKSAQATASTASTAACNGAKKKAKVRPEPSGSLLIKESSSIKGQARPKIQSKTPVEEHTEAENESRREKLQELINDFLASAEAELHCSPEYNTYERMLLHELAEKAQLGHASQGEAKKRHIVLTKLMPKKASEAENAPKMDQKVVKKDETTNVICSTCSQKVPKTNIELHKLRCTRVKIEAEKASEKPLKKKGQKKKSKAKEEEEDIDKLLAAFDKIDNVCNGQGCKVKIATLGVRCDHCAKRFCMKCGLPEAHGCGEAARIAARQQLARDGHLYPGSGRPNFKPDPVKKAQLQRKLDKKLDEMSDSRKRKPPKKK